MVNGRLEPGSGQTKDYKIGIYCCHTILRSRFGWLWIRIQCTRNVILIPQHNKNQTKHVGVVQRGHHHHLNWMSLSWYHSFSVKQHSLTQSNRSLFKERVDFVKVDLIFPKKINKSTIDRQNVNSCMLSQYRVLIPIINTLLTIGSHKY